MMRIKNPILLAILDGFGIAAEQASNAVTKAKMEHFKYLQSTYPSLAIHASGKWVGLPDGQMGNSEVGHLHIGAGRILYQSLLLINNAIGDKSFYENPALLAAIYQAKSNNARLHIIGLLSDGGVHSHINHLLAILTMAKEQQFKDVYVHAILDGRDTKQDVAKKYLTKLMSVMNELQVGYLSSISGRYYAMDRDQRWERMKLAYDVIVQRNFASFSNPLTYIDDEYACSRNDEFIIPAYNEQVADGHIKDNDSVIFTNFRPDRAIQLAAAITNREYVWNSEVVRNNLFFVTMTEYSVDVKANQIAFQSQNVNNGLGEWISKQGLEQLRIAETEKYAHVTYFFDGGRDIMFSGEDRILVSSPRVATYNLKPEMAANEVTKELISKIKMQKYDLIVLNFANPDMVGHTGNLLATIKALQVVDKCLKEIYEPLKSLEGIMVLTADHGNAEIMIDETGDINKKHTSQLVPLVITKSDLKLVTNTDISLANIAPTICDLLGISIPDEMTSKSIIKK
ncbi:2,3-bisphosphoglycerate-independent phosphoglycerate mutase [Spiroplasma endosymbiont of 'Nebria riversi']|uniref:2,3-bisphosphoglycerate-independent phosphoglycerate mutase n=1 Tax=Spiroplasma endosymbiont of 'Nebria riversi' TaxID=2792084 RepID=UPI001FE8B46E|nr:2,3-bisphosphoglycerate-independent phosphoglycerate mutase [Spiroplasma endosymbiont of 'Nebria riversi']